MKTRKQKATPTTTPATLAPVQIFAMYETARKQLNGAQAIYHRTPTKTNARKIAIAEKRLARLEKNISVMGIITAENVQTLGERFAVKALKTYYQKSGMPFVYELYRGLIADITENKQTGAPLSDGYDVVQTACAVLCAYIGKRLDDVSADGQTDKNGNPITIKTAVFRALSKYVNGERQREYKRAYLDDMDENGNALIYEIPVFWDMPTATDYKTVTAKIAEMGLSMNEKRFLTYRLRGYSVDVIAQKMGVKRGTANVYRQRIKAKADKIGLTVNA